VDELLHTVENILYQPQLVGMEPFEVLEVLKMVDPDV
jgi:hypothetical protein